jgi:AbiV family abortive infection protein
MSKPSRQVLVLANATRLLNDATILLDHRSFATAFALAVLAIEEIGKALIDSWSTEAPLAETKSRSLHIQKQTAVASLLLGELAVRQFPKDGAADLEGERLTTVTRLFNESEQGGLFQRIRDQQLDTRKQNAIYQDDWLTAVADDFAEEHVASIFQIAHNARDVISDGHVRRAGRVFYETTLVRG